MWQDCWQGSGLADAQLSMNVQAVEKMNSRPCASF
jgi:hypothetical protein